MNIIRRNQNPLSAYRPGAIEDQFGRLVENMFEDMFAPLVPGASLSRQAFDEIVTPRLDIVENDKEFEIAVEMPGINKEDVKVAIDGKRVTVEGESKRESTQKEGQNVIYSERAQRKIARSFTLPVEVDDAGSQARLENGVLMLTLPKRQETQPKRLTIQ